MVRHVTRLLQIVCFASPVWAQQVSASPNQSAEVTTAGASSKPTLPTSPPDAAVPDPGSLPAPSTGKKSTAKRVLDEVTPRCLDALVHTCWSQPSGAPSASASMAELKFANNMEIANLYFKDKNYAGAESRFREALESIPNNPEATFKLAQSLEKLHKTDEAKVRYLAYLKLRPTGPFSREAEKAVRRLQTRAHK